MKCRWRYLLILGLGFLLGVLVGSRMEIETDFVEEKENRVEDVEEKFDCFTYESAGEFLSMEELLVSASVRLDNNQKVLGLLKDKCLILMGNWYFDVTGDDVEEIIVTTSGYGCGSCHGQTLYVFDRDELIFERGGWNIEVKQTDKSSRWWPGFTMTTPILLFGEAFSGPSYGIETPYQYHQEQKEFMSGFERVIKYLGDW